MTDGFEGDSTYRVLSIDVRAERTLVMLADGRGDLRGFGEAAAGDAPDAEAALEEAVGAAHAAAGDPDLSRVLAVRISTVGDPAPMARALRRLIPYARVSSDLAPAAALASVTLGAPGIIVIASAGSVAFGRCAEGREVTVGGWGPGMGDEGGAVWIARQALSAITKAADGRAEETLLTTLMLRHWRAQNLTSLRQRFHEAEIHHEAIGSASAAVGQAASSGDPVARRILRFAGHELGHLAVTALRRLSMTDSEVTVGTDGGVFRAGESILEPFRQLVQQSAPHVRIASPRVPRVVGGVALALQDLELPLTPEVTGRLERAALAMAGR